MALVVATALDYKIKRLFPAIRNSQRRLVALALMAWAIKATNDSTIQRLIAAARNSREC